MELLQFYVQASIIEHDNNGARVGRQKKKKKIRLEADKKLFHINFDGSFGKPETRLFVLGLRIALPCCVIRIALGNYN